MILFYCRFWMIQYSKVTFAAESVQKLCIVSWLLILLINIQLEKSTDNRLQYFVYYWQWIVLLWTINYVWKLIDFECNKMHYVNLLDVGIWTHKFGFIKTMCRRCMQIKSPNELKYIIKNCENWWLLDANCAHIEIVYLTVNYAYCLIRFVHTTNLLVAFLHTELDR